MSGSGPTRIRVVGNSGAGKTTFARRFATATDLPYLELDAVFWAEDWQLRARDDALSLVLAFLERAREGWVIDGNWNRRLEGLLDDADAVVWLDYSRRVVMPRVVRRTIIRGATRRELWHGNRERLSRLLRWDPEESIVRWAWTQHESYRAAYAELAASGAPVVRLRSPGQASAWLAARSR